MASSSPKQPTISVVMPCFNAERYVETACRSALEQRVDAEVIVVDDGSDDASAAKVRGLEERYDGRLRLLQGRNRGPYPARNRALAECHGRYIAFLDADDWWAPTFMAKMVDAADRTGADLAYCGWQNVGTAPVGHRPYVPPAYEAEDPVRALLKGCPWPIHAALIRREVVAAVGGFSERYRTSMDYDFWLRIAARTTNWVRVPEVLAFYRWHGSTQISAVKWEQTVHAWKVRRDFARNHPRLLAHIPAAERRDKTDGALRRAAYAAQWARELVSARKLFRKTLYSGYWRRADLKYILPSFLPYAVHRRLIAHLDGRRARSPAGI